MSTKDSNTEQPCTLHNVSGCSFGISKVYILNSSDCIIENKEIRLKRKYGKFKREVIVVDYNNR